MPTRSREAQWLLRSANGDINTALNLFYEQSSTRAPQTTGNPINARAIQRLFDEYEGK
jgi:hypothetical protein